MSGQTQTERLVLQIHPKDNVAVAVKPLKKGTVLPGGVSAGTMYFCAAWHT